MNPLEIKTKELSEYFMDWGKVYPVAYNKTKTSPYNGWKKIIKKSAICGLF